MDWKKAKNYTIIFLCILNIVLLGLNALRINKYKLSSAQKKAITDILEKNNIELKTDIETDFKPMAQYLLKSSGYDELELQELFFNKTDGVKRTEEFEQTVFVSGSESLSIEGNTVFYKNENSEEGFTLNEDTAKAAVREYISAVEKEFGKFELSLVGAGENGSYISLRYDNIFMESMFFNNSIVFTVYSDGRKDCSFSFFEPEQMSGEKTDICSADEALFVFLKGIKGTVPEEKKVKIARVDLGYFNEDYLETNAELTCVPYYRICIEGTQTPYYINAYTGTMLFE